MDRLGDKTLLRVRAEAHAKLLETAATLMELDGIGLAPDLGHVHHLRRMAGAIRAQAALGQVPHSYTGGRYLPDPMRTEDAYGDQTRVVESLEAAWH